MRDPIPRNAGRGGHGYVQKFQHTSQVSTSGQAVNGGNSQKRKKSDYCWNYNRGVKCKYGNKCCFIERCSFCDSPSHHLLTCPQAEKKAGNDGTEPSK